MTPDDLLYFVDRVLISITEHEKATGDARCSVDRRIVERHRWIGRGKVEEWSDTVVVLLWCQCCDELMPCPDLSDIASLYGVS